MSEDHMASRDHARSDGGVREPADDAARDFVRMVGRLSHSGDEDYAWPDDPEDAFFTLDRLIATARDIMAMPLRQVLGEALRAHSQTPPAKDPTND